MSRSKTKRVNARRRWLAGLAERNPEGFMTEWKKRLDSWIVLYVDGINRAKTQEISELIIMELESLGSMAINIAFEYTRFRISEASKEVFDTPRHLYCLSNYEALEKNALYKIRARIPGSTSRF